MNYFNWSSTKTPATLSAEQASNMLKTLGTIDKERIAEQKLSFCDTEIAWMTSSGTVRSLWSALNTINASSWSCDLGMLPKLAGRITEVYTTELAKINNVQQATETISLFDDAIVGLDTLKACHYATNEAKSQLVTLAVNSLVQLRDLVVEKRAGFERKQAPEVVSVPVVVKTPLENLQERYNAFRERYLALKSKVVAAAAQRKDDFKTYADYSATVKHSDRNQIEEELPAEIPGNAEFNRLREKFRQLIRLDMLLVIEGEGYGVTR